MKGYKGFSPGLVCRGKQYAENTVFEEDSAEICNSGMHFCKNPFDVLEYYRFANPDGTINDFADVEALDEVKTDDNKKFCTKKLKVGAKIGIPGLVKAFVDFTMTNVETKKTAAVTSGACAASVTSGWRAAAVTSGDDAAAVTSGACAASVTSGWSAAAVTSGVKAASVTSGVKAAAVTSGDCAASVTSGWRAASVTSGVKAAAVTSGDDAAAVTSGYGSAAVTSGVKAAATVRGKDSVAISTGIEGKARGKIGCYIAVAEWVKTGSEYHLKDFQTCKVDGERIKEDTFYMLKNGEFVEVK